ncbi:MAG: 6,7-dimethyl-8-ribityllumazine synthase [Phycisphaerales bacterium]
MTTHDHKNPGGQPSGAGGPPAIAIAVSRYNASITDRLLAGAVRAYQRAGGKARDLFVLEAPGAFELVALAHGAAESRAFAGVLAIGCIIKGETRHDEFLGHAVTQGLVNISLITGVPVGLAVLTVNSMKQAAERAGGRCGDKGEEAMEALLITAAQIEMMQSPEALERAWRGPGNIAKLMSRGDSHGRPDKSTSGGAARGKGRARTARAGRGG